MGHRHAVPKGEKEKSSKEGPIKCFCGCSELNYEQIESYSIMNVNQLLKDTAGLKLFKAFLKIGHERVKPTTLLNIECYELCDKLLQNTEFKDSLVEELVELCPTFEWEERVNEVLQCNNAETEFPALLKELKIECINSIECDQNYYRFRQELSAKINKRHST